MNENDIVQKLDTWNESYFLMVDLIIIFQGRLNAIRKFKKQILLVCHIYSTTGFAAQN